MVYSHRVGGVNAIATILSELVEVINPEKLVLLAKAVQGKTWIQRLGWILEQIETNDDEKRDSLVTALEIYLKDQRFFYIPAAPELQKTGYPRHKKWKIIANTTV